MSELVVDASAFVDVLISAPAARPVTERLRGHRLHAPAHFDAEVLSALGRLARAGALSDDQVDVRLARLSTAPLHRHALPELLDGAWRRRHDTRLVDALYVELAAQLDDALLITTDARLAAVTPTAELVGPPDA